MKLATWNLNSLKVRLPRLLEFLAVTRADVDVYDPAAFAGSTHVTPAEPERLGAMLHAGLVDAFRELHPEEVASPGGTTARATSTAGWACGSTTSCWRPSMRTG